MLWGLATYTRCEVRILHAAFRYFINRSGYNFFFLLLLHFSFLFFFFLRREIKFKTTNYALYNTGHGVPRESDEYLYSSVDCDAPVSILYFVRLHLDVISKCDFYSEIIIFYHYRVLQINPLAPGDHYTCVGFKTLPFTKRP